MEESVSIKKDRAFIELNLDNLENNINEIKSIINNKCKIMAVVKANAYGHGMIKIAKKLNQIGIYDFAVATLSEAITLRENKIKGNILILGYTDFNDIEYILKYDLIQTVIDFDYAKRINDMNLKEKIKVHVKINTGMNRIGESYKNIDKLVQIYNMKNLNILGTYTHLCVADSMIQEDIDFTKSQIDNFYSAINALKNHNLDVGKIHIQSSYGLLNYPKLECDFVRMGIIMYGVYSSKNDLTNVKINIKPVLELKARVTSVKNIAKKESVSYGRTYIANKLTKIASVSIGYADGYPRNLSNTDTKVLVNGNYAKIVGRICMDQLMIDVSDIDVKQGDIVTLIGNEDEISAESIASKANTITNDLLSRLGCRLERI